VYDVSVYTDSEFLFFFRLNIRCMMSVDNRAVLNTDLALFDSSTIEDFHARTIQVRNRQCWEIRSEV